MCCERDAGFSGHEVMVLESPVVQKTLAFLREIADRPCACEGEEICDACHAGYLEVMHAFGGREWGTWRK
jgi:hypothetical protein